MESTMKKAFIGAAILFSIWGIGAICLHWGFDALENAFVEPEAATVTEVEQVEDNNTNVNVTVNSGDVTVNIG